MATRAAETVNVRMGQIGLDSAQKPGETIKPEARRDSRPVGLRELPSISIELHGTLGPQTSDDAGPASGRDLEVVRTLGEGGMARVFLARQHSLDRDVAIKTVRDTATDVERRALLSEGAITGYLEHPSVIPVHALGVDHEGRPALVMKWVEGSTWLERLAAEPQDLDANIEILIQVSNAVDFAHSRGIVHRDIKPENVMLGRFGEVYLADWGIALRMGKGAEVTPLCGTPSYMAPEMVIGGIIDERTDVYLLGATLHRILVGKPRHVATDVRATLVLAMDSQPYDYPPSVPAPLAELANRATHFDAEMRPKSAAEFRRRLGEYLRHKGSIALAKSARERIAKLRASAPDFDVLAAEARFAIDEAKRSWEENPEAARASAELEAVLEARRARAAELERIARELDPQVSRLPRAGLAAATSVVSVGLAISAFVTDRSKADVRALFLESLVPTGAVALLIWAFRGSLLRTTLNRQASGGLFIIVAAISVHRAFAMLAGMSAPHALVGDCLIAAAVTVSIGMAVFRWMLWPAAVMLGAALWAAAVPPDAVRAFSAGAGCSILLCVFFALRTSAEKSA